MKMSDHNEGFIVIRSVIGYKKTIKQCWRLLTCLRVTKFADVGKIVSVYTSPVLKEGNVLFINLDEGN